MKKLLLAAVVAVFGAAACSSGNANTKTADGRTASSSKNAKYQIIDQEFDNLLAPDADYDTIPDYELQACGDSYLPPATTPLKGATKPAVRKPAKQAASSASTAKSSDVNVNKKVINNTNIYYLDGSAPNTSTTSTTTYTSEEALPPADVPDTL
ncbi:hypothetical protein [Candidatus Avelusimicrobium gallicola]|uniref:Uncharacterized protein n=1 Tax=Candidatus Avelusimicrobium gallicola TaxID=2562704 RepID=A0A1Y4DHR9_9BACT|nr:hypothetical protein [Elusimicrobium sp. An273]OUO56478.1 hypothetical protein B5F75_04600 [Elusimicrobium sp. An273]